jgi:hypothetical protein
VVAVLLYLRHNLSQPLLAELFGCSQPTISRLVTLLLPALTEALATNTQATAERELRSTVRVDGFLVPIGDRRKDTYTSGMYSGKRHRCGFNVQVVASWHGRLGMTGHPQPGAMHDARAFRESGLAEVFVGRMHTEGGPGGFADTAYTGTGLMVPKRRTGPDQPLSEHTRAYNKAIASHRACVERVIAHLARSSATSASVDSPPRPHEPPATDHSTRTKPGPPQPAGQDQVATPPQQQEHGRNDPPRLDRY